MWFPSWLRNQQRSPFVNKRPAFRPALETLEDRWLPSTLTVNTIADSGSGSLRADIAAAHNGDTIVFDTSLTGQTITLKSGELLIKHNITIAGLGADKLTISGGNSSRVFEVAATVAKPVTLSGLTISDGNADTYGGGAGILNAATLTVSNCTLSNNITTGDGGGIQNDGTLTVNNCIFSHNEGDGGGIYNSGYLTVSGCTLSDNTAGRGFGGGIENHGTATVNDSTLSGNSAHYGGGIYNQSGTVGRLTVKGSTLFDNSAIVGGGIDMGNGSLTISGCTLSSNSATSAGGGIYVNNGPGAYASTVTVSNSVIGPAIVNGSMLPGNTATTSGGGIYVASGATVYLDSFTVTNIINNTDSSGLNGPTANIDGSYMLR